MMLSKFLHGALILWTMKIGRYLYILYIFVSNKNKLVSIIIHALLRKND